ALRRRATAYNSVGALRRFARSVGRATDAPTHRCVLDAADEARTHALDRAGELAGLETRTQLREGVVQLEARQVCAEADVLAHAEADVRVRVAIAREGEGIGEDLLVAIGGGVEETDRLPAADRLPA